MQKKKKICSLPGEVFFWQPIRRKQTIFFPLALLVIGTFSHCYRAIQSYAKSFKFTVIYLYVTYFRHDQQVITWSQTDFIGSNVSTSQYGLWDVLLRKFGRWFRWKWKIQFPLKLKKKIRMSEPSSCNCKFC